MAGKGQLRVALAIAMVSAMFSVSGATGVQAEAIVVALSKVALQSSRVQVTRTSKFDWLARRAPRERILLVSGERTVSQIGKGSWICSPAGFGKKSRCYAN
jgi:hypothetical protein